MGTTCIRRCGRRCRNRPLSAGVAGLSGRKGRRHLVWCPPHLELGSRTRGAGCLGVALRGVADRLRRIIGRFRGCTLRPRHPEPMGCSSCRRRGIPTGDCPAQGQCREIDPRRRKTDTAECKELNPVRKVNGPALMRPNFPTPYHSRAEGSSFFSNSARPAMVSPTPGRMSTSGSPCPIIASSKITRLGVRKV